VRVKGLGFFGTCVFGGVGDVRGLSVGAGGSEFFAVSPLAFDDLAIGFGEDAFAMLFAIFPAAFIHASIGPTSSFEEIPSEGSFPFLTIFYIFSNVGASISPFELSNSVHFVLSPLAIILSFIGPLIDALAMDVVIHELSFVLRAIDPHEIAHAMFLASLIVSLIPRSIWPKLNAFPMLLVIDPVAFVDRSVEVRVFALAMSLVVNPIPLVDVSVVVDQPTLAVGLVLAPRAIVP
jgi:hypothetical protein